MKTQFTLLFICAIILSIASSINIVPVYGSPSVELQVTRVVWGTDPDNPVKTYPGDAETPLTVEMQNSSPNETIKGVKAVLMLQDHPFTDIYGSSNEIISYFLLPNQLLRNSVLSNQNN